mgnify:CR=1 FL=1
MADIDAQLQGIGRYDAEHLALAIEGHGMSISIGLPDRVLAPFVNADRVGADFDAEGATDLVAAFMLKVAANSVFS